MFSIGGGTIGTYCRTFCTFFSTHNGQSLTTTVFNLPCFSINFEFTVVPARLPHSSENSCLLFAGRLNKNVYVFLGPSFIWSSCLSEFKLLLFGRRHQYLRIDCSEVSSILERPSHHQPRQQSPRQQSSSSSNTEKRLDKLIVELKVELGDGTDDIFCLFFGSRDGVSSKPRCRFLHPGDVV